MAKVVGPLHSSEARGSVGALTYNTWRGISTVKARTGPTTQYSSDQVALRAKTALATAAWQALTDSQRAAWHNYAVQHVDVDWTGNPQRLSGYNWFIRINVRRQIIATGIENDPPDTPFSYAFEGFSVYWDNPFIRTLWTPQYDFLDTSCQVEVYVAGPHSPGRHPNLPESDRHGNVSEFMGFYTFTPAPASTYTCFARAMFEDGQVCGFRRGTAASP